MNRMNPSICFVVNAVDTSSIPAEIAGAIAKGSEFNVDILAWFDADDVDSSFPGSVRCLNADGMVPNLDTTKRTSALLSDYDILHTHHNHSGAIAKLIGQRIGIPVISTEHNDHNAFTRKSRLANGLTNALADRVTCVSQSVYDSFRLWERAILSEQQTEVIYNGVDLDLLNESSGSEWDLREEYDISEEALIIGNAAMLTEQKGQDTLIRAITVANRISNLDIELVISGSGPERDQLEKIATECDVTERIHFLGFLEQRAQVHQMMASVDVFAMPSRWEGFCVAVPEAMAQGTPCILSNIDVFQELYEGAARFHPVDDVTELADQLSKLTMSPKLRRRFGNRGRTLVRQQYTLSRTVKEYVDTYRKLLASNYIDTTI